MLEVFYTGGGIWLAEVEINEIGDYAVINSEYPDIISLYHKPSDGETKYLPEDMYMSMHSDNLGIEMGALHSRMLSELQRKIAE